MTADYWRVCRTLNNPNAHFYRMCRDGDHTPKITPLFSIPIDVVNREGLKPWIAPTASADAVYAL